MMRGGMIRVGGMDLVRRIVGMSLLASRMGVRMLVNGSIMRLLMAMHSSAVIDVVGRRRIRRGRGMGRGQYRSALGHGSP